MYSGPVSILLYLSMSQRRTSFVPPTVSVTYCTISVLLKAKKKITALICMFERAWVGVTDQRALPKKTQTFHVVSLFYIPYNVFTHCRVFTFRIANGSLVCWFLQAKVEHRKGQETIFLLYSVFKFRINTRDRSVVVGNINVFSQL